MARPRRSSSSAALEVRGVVREHGVTLVSIFDGAANRSSWIAVSAREADIAVLSYDDVADRVRIQVDGREMTLALKASREASTAKFTVLIVH